MTKNSAAAPAALLLRPITCSILLALAGVAGTPVSARDLNGEAHSVELLGASTLIGNRSLIKDGGILIRDDAFAHLRDSEIRIDATAPGFDRLNTIGIDMDGTADDDTPSLTLSGTRMTVEANPAKDLFSSGIGVRQGAGRVILQQGTKITADNVGVLMRGLASRTAPLSLSLDNADIQTFHGAAIQVAPGDTASNDYVITVANGSPLKAGDGTLLHIGGPPGSHASGQTSVKFSVDGSTIVGDVIFDRTTVTGTLDVSLLNEAYLLGRFENVNFVGLINGARWHLTGDSDVRSLQVSGTSSVKLGLGVDGSFNTLRVESFEGRLGELIFNTALGDDTSLTDRLVVTGDATGEAGVRVLNAGGHGGQTQQGIELIRIEGTSDALFTLRGRAVGGQYEYFLIKGEDGNWYLRSQAEQPETPHECLQNPQLPHCEITLPVEPIDPENPNPEIPDPESPDPENPGIPQPVLRPETGVYLANQYAMSKLLQHRARERMIAADAVDGARTWATTAHSEQRMQAGGQQMLRTRQQRVQMGVDIAAFDHGQGRLGAMLTAGRADSTSRSTVTGYAAQGRVEGGALGVYAHWAGEALYLDASVQRGHFRNRVQGEGIAMERHDAQLWQGALETGYRFRAGRIGNSTWQLQPQVQITHTRSAMDAHVEDNGTVVEQIADSSLSTRLGLRLEGDVVTARAHLKPYAEFNAHHRTETEGLRFDGETLDAVGPQSWTTLAVGGQAQFGGGLAAWGEIDLGRGGEGYRELGARVGVSYRW